MALSEREREALYERLSGHAAADHLQFAELERRIAAVDAAQTVEEAYAVLADLPALPTDPRVVRTRRPRWGRGHGEAERPGSGWLPTPERFRDPRSGRVMRVWVDAAGGRHYLADDAT